MGVDVHGDANGRMSENRGQGLHMHSFSGAVCGEGVAEGVEGVSFSGVKPSVAAHAVDDFLHAFVDVLPLESENFSDAETGQNGEMIDVPISGGLGASDKFRKL